MKKTKQPGENISLKTKKSEDPAVMDWINAQTNLMDSLRYLIENEVLRNGVRNLQTCIPMERPALTDPGTMPPAEVAAAGVRELQRVQEEVSAGLAVQSEEEQHQAVAARTEAQQPDGGERAEAEPPADEEIDEDDIDSWL